MATRVVLISGKKQSGKDEAAKILVANGFKKAAFADALKELSTMILNHIYLQFSKSFIKREDFEQETFKNEFIAVGNTNPITNRQFLQYFGTEFMRTYIYKDIWVAITARRILEHAKTMGNADFVITDVRFPNEIEALQKYLRRYLMGDVQIIKVRVDRHQRSLIGKYWDKFTQHSSETGLDFYKDWDYFIPNYGSLSDYKKSVKSLVKKILAR